MAAVHNIGFLNLGFCYSYSLLQNTKFHHHQNAAQLNNRFTIWHLSAILNLKVLRLGHRSSVIVLVSPVLKNSSKSVDISLKWGDITISRLLSSAILDFQCRNFSHKKIWSSVFSDFASAYKFLQKSDNPLPSYGRKWCLTIWRLCAILN